MIFGLTKLLATYVLLAIIGQLIEAGNELPSCLDDNGKPVDWFFVYKLPVLNKQGYPYNTGYSYVYMTSDMVEGTRRGRDIQWVLSDKLINDPNSMILRTLAPAYGNSAKAKRLSSIFYNDHLPETEKLSHMANGNYRRAHAKGAILFDENNGDGLWLSHSTPRWPPLRDEPLTYAENSRGPGQSFLCLSFNLMESGKQIFNHLLMMQPYVFQSQFGKNLLKKMPELFYLQVDSFRGMRKNVKAPNKIAQTMTTRAGQEFMLFSKSGVFMKDVYSDWLDHELDSNLSVETWRNGAGNTLDSICERGEHHVNNVEALNIINQNMDIIWSYTQDHSKWLVTENPQNPVVCITDANRALSQFARGSGAICIKCPSCWLTFMRTIKRLEPCEYKKPERPTKENPKKSRKL